MFEDPDPLFPRAFSAEARLEQVITAFDAVVMEADKFSCRRMCLACGDGSADSGDGGMLVQGVSDRYHGGFVAPTHAGGTHDPHTGGEPRFVIGQQLLRAGELAAE